MTVEEALKRAKMCIGISPSENIMESFKVISDAIEEIQQYRAIGTVSEFRELKEKATAKKPNGIFFSREDGCRVGNCPSCGRYIKHREHKHCPRCGSLIDWSEGKE